VNILINISSVAAWPS